MEIEGCALPEDRLYDLENDTWLRLDPGSTTATLGITNLLASFAGRFTSVTYRPVVGRIDAGRSVATLESVRFVGAVRLPVAALVVERNPALAARPKLLNDRPFDDGWVVRIALDQPLDLPATLETAAVIEAKVRERIRERRVVCWPASPDTELFEIGAECAAILVRLDETLGTLPPGGVVLLVTDDPTSPIELVRWSDRTGHAVLGHRSVEGLHHFLVRREEHPAPRRR